MGMPFSSQISSGDPWNIPGIFLLGIFHIATTFSGDICVDNLNQSLLVDWKIHVEKADDDRVSIHMRERTRASPESTRLENLLVTSVQADWQR
jgi:hypothetical protein